MRCLHTIAAVSLLLAACSSPPDGKSDSGNDVGTSPDAGVDAAVTDGGATEADTASAELLQGELVAEVPDGAEDVRIYDAGEFLFVVTDGRDLGWVSKTGPTVLSYAVWPDATRPDDGPPSRDIAWDDERFWFLSEAADGTWSLIGAEHFLGNPSPLFGQPIIIIDIGPGEPAGLARFGGLFAIPVDDQLVTVSEGTMPVRTPLGGTPVFDTFDGPWLFLATDAGFELKQFGPNSGQLTTFESVPEAPIAFAASADGVYFLSAAGELRQDGGMTENDATTIFAEARPSESPLLAAGAAGAAWTGDDEVRFFTEELLRYEASDIDAIVVDETDLYWSGSEGIFRGTAP